jgi:signal transduction histidine kinase/ligand-binding sensor domain-containing protein/CheY-like chemotaxis protein
LVSWLILLAGVVGRAQDLRPADLRFEHLTVDQGLAHSDAKAVTQDRAGFIWVGTVWGIDRYDGYQLQHYKLPVNRRNGFSSNRILSLLTDPDGRIWAGTERAGLVRYDPDHDAFVGLDEASVPAADRARARSLAQCNVQALAADRQHRLWIGTAQQGLFVLSLDAQGRVRSLRQLTLPGGAGVNCLAVDDEQQVWVGSNQAGLLVVRAQLPGSPIEPTDVPERNIHAVHLDRRGDLWVGTEHRVLWVPAASRRSRRQVAAHPLPDFLPRVQSLLLDSRERLWAGTLYGLYAWEAGPSGGAGPPVRPAPTLLLPQNDVPNRLNAERVHQVYEDRSQVLWLCTSAGGLNKVDLRQKQFGQLLAGNFTSANNYINAIYKEEATNTLWLGTRNGVAAYDLIRHTYRYYLSQTTDVARTLDVSTICAAADGTLWFGMRQGGLASLRRPAGGGPPQLRHVKELAGGLDLQQVNIEHIAQDQKGDLWVATLEEGLLRLGPDGRLLARYTQRNARLPSSRFTYVLYDTRRNVLWANTHDAGLLKLRPAADSLQLLAHYGYTPGQPSALAVNSTWPLLLTGQGDLWIGTIGGGLYRLTTDGQGRDHVRSFAHDLPVTDVESLLTDEAGRLWVGGNGLYCFTPRTRQYVRYDVADGLQSNAFKVGAAARGADGTLYFGGINGVSYFQPASIEANPRPPVVQFTGLRVDNRPVAVGKVFNGRVLLPHPLGQVPEITIRAAENDFSVAFVALNYVNPQKNQYAYRLLGYNESWVSPPPGQRTASFTSLPPGHYTLQVRASNGEGRWSSQPAALRFHVLAPWYKTGWAYLLYAGLALGAVALYRHVELRQEKLKNKLALEQFQAEKEQELTRLKLGFFTNVSHELRTPLTLILGPMEEIMRSAPAPDLRGRLHLMHQQARKLLELVNQLLDFRKVESGHLPLRAAPGAIAPFLTEVFGTFEPKARERQLAYQLDLPAEPLELYFDRSKLEIILTNLLANAFTYTPDGGRVTLAATAVGSPDYTATYDADQNLADNYLRISVADSGVGIAPGELAHIFDPYYQAAHTTTLRMTGTGIGLALARQFAERHGGQLLVSSKPGVGSTFELRLPFGRQHLRPEDVQPAEALAAPEISAPEPAETEPTPPTAAGTGPPRLLLVEDNEEVRAYLLQLFEGDYQVSVAADGLAGWTAALAQLPDLIISDVMMPRSDGLEMCQKIKQHPKTSHIPVLLLTARTAETQELEGLGVGADDYVSKPFNPQLLQARAATLLRNRRKLHEFYQRDILLQPTEIVIADADREFLAKAMGVVEKHLGDSELGVQLLIGEMAMSQSVFYRRIKSITGQTVVEFIRDVRLKRAAQLLAQSTLRVSEVGFEVGIENVKYFRQVFQKLYGVTPSEYARQHRGVTAPAANEEE